MLTARKTLLSLLFLPALALLAVLCSSQAYAGAVAGSADHKALLEASGALFTGSELLNANGLADSVETVADRRKNRKRDNDRFDDRRENKRYPRCKSIRNHDSKKYKNCVFRYYVKNRRDQDRWDDDRRGHRW